MKYKLFFWTMLLMVLLAAVVTLIPPFFLQQFSETTLTFEKILFILMLLVISKVVSILLTLYREKFAKEYNKENFRQYMRSALSMRYDDIIEQGPVNIMEKIANSVNSIYSYMTGPYIQLWSNVIILVGCMVLGWQISYQITLILLVLLVVNFFGYKTLNRKLKTRSQRLQKETAEGFQQIISSVQQVDYIKQSESYEYILKSFDPSIEKIYGSMAKVNEFAQVTSMALRSLNEIAQNFILIYLTYVVTAESISPYVLVLSSVILPLFFSSMNSIVNTNLNQQNYKIAKEYQIQLDQCREDEQGIDVGKIQEISLDVKKIEIGEKVLPFSAQGVIHKGQVVKICGASGTGKSSFVKGLLKFRKMEGVLLNGYPIEECSIRSIRRSMEYISQNVPIIQGTLRDNLFLNLKWSRELESKVLQERILQTIFQSKTMDSMIREGGANLSGGEKQKIAIARALLKDVDVLILDEITSNIDKKSAMEIYERIMEQKESRITFIISHDDICDQMATIKLNEIH